MLGNFLALTSIICCVFSKPLNVSLEAPWYPVSEGIIALETIHKYNSSSYFPLLSVLLSEKEKAGESRLPAEEDILFSNALKSHFLSNVSVGVAKQDFNLGTVLPNVEAQMSMFESIGDESLKDCPVIVWTEGGYTCDRTDLFALKTVNEPALPELYASDHVIGTGEQWIVAYADFNHPEFAEWHATLLEMALMGKISYVLRHRTPLAGGLNGVNLAGYGVDVKLKRTDYLVVDDRQLDGEQLQLDLDAPNKIAASKIPYLGFAATREIRQLLDSTPEKQFHLLRELSFNFPQYAAELASSATEQDFEEDMINGNHVGAYGFNGLFVDGHMAKFTDAFNLFDALKNELDVITVLESYLPPNANIPNLLTSGWALDTDDLNATTETKQRYDLSKDASAIGWINDIEKDSLYQQLGDDLSILHSIDSPFVPLRRNMHSIVITGDLEDKQTLQLIGTLLKQSGQQLPLQVGLVSNSPFWKKISKLCLEARQAFIIGLLKGASFETAEAQAISVHEDMEKPARTVIGDPQKWMQKFGIENLNVPTVFVNGYLLPVNMWKERALEIFEEDTNYLRSLKNLHKVKSLRDTLFKLGNPRRNKLLEPIDGVEFAIWPIDSPIQSFRNPEQAAKNSQNQTARHTILFSSSFATPQAFDIADAILERSHSQNDVDLFIRPLAGIDERFYASILDPTYSMFRFSRDLMQAAKGHLFLNKTEPKVFTIAKEPELDVAQLPSDEDYLILDGRLIYAEEFLNPDTPIDASTLGKLLERESPRVKRLQANLPDISGIGVAALTAAAQDRTMITEHDRPDIKIDGEPGSMSVTIVVDPATPAGQELIALGEAAINANLTVMVFLSPSQITEVPSRFYKPVYDRHHAHALFDNLEDDVLYTAEIVEPPSWVTVAKECKYDLDNIVLNLVKESYLSAKYSVRGVLIEGYSIGNSSPGLQLDLYDSSNTKIADTMVMANLGYFQFQAPHPGNYKVCMSDPQYSFMVNTSETTDCLRVSSNSFSGYRMRPTVVKSAATSSNLEKKGGIWNKFSGIVGRGHHGNNQKNADKDADINIFTIASGHLYERFASIMMLSVMEHTEHTVKFWLIENFLSPKFKQFVPELSKEYGFKYEFISYKWPSWLRKQTEKQREIWGYKMLFLDVIFPQTLSNIIFVDSDQIVRTDFQDLLDIDLQGAPYAFTPMGDDREEMEPFRFWKQGFWKTYLLEKGLDYHISALYRVDLNRLRKTKVGDILRQQYQQLSADPTNLANLDQDLPNSLQTVVPIHSLSPDWLWCETWCSDDGLKMARTIDLCNNPLTKEPKLDRARRQIPEWVEYDRMVADLQSKVDKMANDPQLDREEPAVDESLRVHQNEHSFDDGDDLDHDEL